MCRYVKLVYTICGCSQTQQWRLADCTRNPCDVTPDAIPVTTVADGICLRCAVKLCTIATSSWDPTRIITSVGFDDPETAYSPESGAVKHALANSFAARGELAAIRANSTRALGDGKKAVDGAGAGLKAGLKAGIEAHTAELDLRSSRASATSTRVKRLPRETALLEDVDDGDVDHDGHDRLARSSFTGHSENMSESMSESMREISETMRDVRDFLRNGVLPHVKSSPSGTQATNDHTPWLDDRAESSSPTPTPPTQQHTTIKPSGSIISGRSYGNRQSSATKGRRQEAHGRMGTRTKSEMGGPVGGMNGTHPTHAYLLSAWSDPKSDDAGV